MQSEIEAKFINVDHDEVRQKLQKAGAVCEQPMRLMRRMVFHTDEMHANNSFVRVRDEGHRVTMTYKQFTDRGKIDGVKEIETTVGDFEIASELLEKAGLVRESYQETKRETWRLDEVEVVLDEWPWLRPLIEIEGPTEAAVRKAAEKLGFSWNDAVFGGVATVFARQYPNMGDNAHEIINRQIPIVRFEDPIPTAIEQGK